MVDKKIEKLKKIKKKYVNQNKCNLWSQKNAENGKTQKKNKLTKNDYISTKKLKK